MTIKGSLLQSIPIVKTFLTLTLVPSKIGRTFAFFGKIFEGLKIPKVRHVTPHETLLT